MENLPEMTLAEVIYKLADVESDAPQCPQAASLAYAALESTRELQIFTLSQIAHLPDEPWAAQVAADWIARNVP